MWQILYKNDFRIDKAEDGDTIKEKQTFIPLSLLHPYFKLHFIRKLMV